MDRAGNDDVRVRHASTAAEQQATYRIRYEVYVEEMGEFRFAADHGNRVLTDPSDETARHYYVTSRDRIVGALRYHIERDSPFSAEDESIYGLARFRAIVGDRMAILSRFNVHKDFRVGSAPSELLLESLPFSDDVELVFCTCQPHLLNLYLRLGFRSCGPAFNDPVASAIAPLVLVRGDVEHLRNIGSALADRLLPEPESLALAEKVQAVLGPPFVRRVTDGAWESTFTILQRPAGSVFQGLTSEEVRSLLSPSFFIDLRRWDRVVRERQATRTVFCAVSGHFEVRDGTRCYLLDPGAVFGEESFLLCIPRTSSVYVVSEKACVLAMSEKALRGICDSHTRATSIFLLNLSRGLARKMTRTAP